MFKEDCGVRTNEDVYRLTCGLKLQNQLEELAIIMQIKTLRLKLQNLFLKDGDMMVGIFTSYPTDDGTQAKPYWFSYIHLEPQTVAFDQSTQKICFTKLSMQTEGESLDTRE